MVFLPKGGESTLNKIAPRIAELELTYEGVHISTRFRAIMSKYGVTGKDESLLVTHNSHSFVNIIPMRNGRYGIGFYIKVNDEKVRFVLDMPTFEYNTPIPIKESNIVKDFNEAPEARRQAYESLCECGAVPKFPVDQDFKREYMTRLLQDDYRGTIYMTADNSDMPRIGAFGNIFIKSYKESDTRIEFTYSFYGTVEGKYVGFDDAPRGSLEPNYKMVAKGYGLKEDEKRKLIFSFRHDGRDYLFRYEYDRKPNIGQAYHVSTDDATTNTIMKEVPDEFVVGKATGKPVFFVDYRGKKVEASEDNDVEQVFEQHKKKEIKDLQFEAPEDFEKLVNPVQQTHIKERPMPVAPEEGLVNKELVIHKAAEHIRKVRSEFDEKGLISFKQESPSSIVVRILQPKEEAYVVLRLKCGKKVVAVQYEDDGQWIDIKRFDAENQGKAIGRLLNVIKKNL